MRKVTALAVAMLMAFAAGGCSSDNDKKSPTTPQGKAKASASASAAAASSAAVVAGDLRTAVAELARTSYKYTLKAGDASGGGSVDPVGKQTGVNIAIAADGQPYRTDVLMFGPELYTKISGLPLPGLDGTKWFKLDRAKIKSFTALGIPDIDDPSGVNTLAKTIATIKKTGANSYQGTLDLSKGSAAFSLDEAAARQLGDRAKSIPFEATVTAQGKLASWKMTIPAHGAEKETAYELTFSDHGAPVALTKPTGAQLGTPPDALYEMLQA